MQVAVTSSASQLAAPIEGQTKVLDSQFHWRCYHEDTVEKGANCRGTHIGGCNSGNGRNKTVGFLQRAQRFPLVPGAPLCNAGKRFPARQESIKIVLSQRRARSMDKREPLIPRLADRGHRCTDGCTRCIIPTRCFSALWSILVTCYR